MAQPREIRLKLRIDDDGLPLDLKKVTDVIGRTFEGAASQMVKSFERAAQQITQTMAQIAKTPMGDSSIGVKHLDQLSAKLTEIDGKLKAVRQGSRSVGGGGSDGGSDDVLKLLAQQIKGFKKTGATATTATADGLLKEIETLRGPGGAKATVTRVDGLKQAITLTTKNLNDLEKFNTQVEALATKFSGGLRRVVGIDKGTGNQITLEKLVDEVGNKLQIRRVGNTVTAARVTPVDYAQVDKQVRAVQEQSYLKNTEALGAKRDKLNEMIGGRDPQRDRVEIAKLTAKRDEIVAKIEKQSTLEIQRMQEAQEEQARIDFAQVFRDGNENTKSAKKSIGDAIKAQNGAYKELGSDLRRRVAEKAKYYAGLDKAQDKENEAIRKLGIEGQITRAPQPEDKILAIDDVLTDPSLKLSKIETETLNQRRVKLSQQVQKNIQRQVVQAEADAKATAREGERNASSQFKQVFGTANADLAKAQAEIEENNKILAARKQEVANGILDRANDFAKYLAKQQAAKEAEASALQKIDINTRVAAAGSTVGRIGVLNDLIDNPAKGSNKADIAELVLARTREEQKLLREYSSATQVIAKRTAALAEDAARATLQDAYAERNPAAKLQKLGSFFNTQGAVNGTVNTPQGQYGLSQQEQAKLIREKTALESRIAALETARANNADYLKQGGYKAVQTKLELGPDGPSSSTEYRNSAGAVANLNSESQKLAVTLPKSQTLWERFKKALSFSDGERSHTLGFFGDLAAKFYVIRGVMLGLETVLVSPIRNVANEFIRATEESRKFEIALSGIVGIGRAQQIDRLLIKTTRDLPQSIKDVRQSGEALASLPAYAAKLQQGTPQQAVSQITSLNDLVRRMAILDPAQGTEGSLTAVRELLEGGGGESFRSLRTRFGITAQTISRQLGKSIDQVKADPALALEGVKKIVETLLPDDAIEESNNLITTKFQKIEDAISYAYTRLGDSGLFNKTVGRLDGLKKSLETYFDSDDFLVQAQKLSSAIDRAVGNIAKSVVNLVRRVTGAGEGQSTLDAAVTWLGTAVDRLGAALDHAPAAFDKVGLILRSVVVTFEQIGDSLTAAVDLLHDPIGNAASGATRGMLNPDAKALDQLRSVMSLGGLDPSKLVTQRVDFAKTPEGMGSSDLAYASARKDGSNVLMASLYGFQALPGHISQKLFGTRTGDEADIPDFVKSGVTDPAVRSRLERFYSKISESQAKGETFRPPVEDIAGLRGLVRKSNGSIGPLDKLLSGGGGQPSPSEEYYRDNQPDAATYATYGPVAYYNANEKAVSKLFSDSPDNPNLNFGAQVKGAAQFTRNLAPDAINNSALRQLDSDAGGAFKSLGGIDTILDSLNKALTKIDADLSASKPFGDALLANAAKTGTPEASQKVAQFDTMRANLQGGRDKLTSSAQTSINAIMDQLQEAGFVYGTKLAESISDVPFAEGLRRQVLDGTTEFAKKIRDALKGYGRDVKASEFGLDKLPLALQQSTVAQINQSRLNALGLLGQVGDQSAVGANAQQVLAAFRGRPSQTDSLQITADQIERVLMPAQERVLENARAKLAKDPNDQEAVITSLRAAQGYAELASQLEQKRLEKLQRISEIEERAYDRRMKLSELGLDTRKLGVGFSGAQVVAASSGDSDSDQQNRLKKVDIMQDQLPRLIQQYDDAKAAFEASGSDDAYEMFEDKKVQLSEFVRQLKAAKREADELQVAYENFAVSVRSSLEANLGNAIGNLIRGTGSLRDALVGFANDVTNAFSQMAANQLLMALLGDAGKRKPDGSVGQGSGGLIGTIGSALGSIFAGGSTTTGSTAAAFADGGVLHGPRLALAGEAGPEAYIPMRGGHVPIGMTRSGEFFASLPGGRRISAKMEGGMRAFASGGVWEGRAPSHISPDGGMYMPAQRNFETPQGGGDTYIVSDVDSAIRAGFRKHRDALISVVSGDIAKGGSIGKAIRR